MQQPVILLHFGLKIPHNATSAVKITTTSQTTITLTDTI